MAEILQPMANLGIINSGSYVGERVITNSELLRIMRASGYKDKPGEDPLTADWFWDKLGIRERPYADPDHKMPTSYMSIEAAREAMGDTDPASISYIIVGTTTHDRRTPATAFEVQEALGLKNALPCDLGNACNSFSTALLYASAILNLRGERALVIGAETLSRHIDFTDPNSAGIFSDGAAAVVIGRTPDTDPESGLITFVTSANSSSKEQLILPVTQIVETDEEDKKSDQEDEDEEPEDPKIELGKIFMDGPRVAGTILRLVPDLVPLVLSQAGWPADSVHRAIMHQASGAVIPRLVDRLPISADIIPVYFDTLGNASAATVGLTLDRQNKEGVINVGDRLLIISVGIGASALVMAWRR